MYAKEINLSNKKIILKKKEMKSTKTKQPLTLSKHHHEQIYK